MRIDWSDGGSHCLIERAATTVFMKRYDARDPEGEFRPLQGTSRGHLIAAAA